METFFYVMLPNIALFLAGLGFLLLVIFVLIPWGRNLTMRNRDIKDYAFVKKELNEARGVLELIAKSAEDDSMLEVQLGSSLKRVQDVVNQTKQLER
jgi:hypothetical protein